MAAKTKANNEAKSQSDIRKGQFLYLIENTTLNQKEIAKKLKVTPSTIHNYHRQNQLGKLEATPIPVDLNEKTNTTKPGNDQALANERKAKFVYLIENTELLQTDIAKIIGVSKAAVVKYNKAYKEGKYEGVSPIKPDKLEQYFTALNTNSEEEIEARNEIENSMKEAAGAVELSLVEDGSISEENLVEENASIKEEIKDSVDEEDLEHDSFDNNDFIQATIIETALESASTKDISTILNLFTKQLNVQNLYDLKIVIKKKN